MAYASAAFVFVLSVVAAFVVAFANGMASAPSESNRIAFPGKIVAIGGAIAVVIALTHGATW